jgi:pimeloyl-ACP methyl ester carboxylesterase
VAEHPFDWRRSLASLGVELRDRLRAEPGPVTLVAHSFGGLVARAAIRAGASSVDKLIMLGTPNQGTFAVVQALRGDHWVLRVLAAIDGERDARALARGVFSSFPSVYEQLPARAAPGDLDFYALPSWPDEGPRPREALLGRAAGVRASLAETKGRFVVIAGHGYPTIERAARAGAGLRYEGSTAGDGWVAARDAGIAGSPCYFARAAHVGMPNHPGVIDAVLDLIERDSTSALPTTFPPGDRLPAETDDTLSPAPFEGRTGDDLREADLAVLTAQILNL